MKIIFNEIVIFLAYLLNVSDTALKAYVKVPSKILSAVKLIFQFTCLQYMGIFPTNCEEKKVDLKSDNTALESSMTDFRILVNVTYNISMIVLQL